MTIVMPFVSDVYRAGQHGSKCKRLEILACCNQWQPNKYKDLKKPVLKDKGNIVLFN